MKKLFLIFAITVLSYNACCAEDEMAFKYYSEAKSEYENGDISEAAGKIKIAKELGKQDAEQQQLAADIAAALSKRGGERYNSDNLEGAIDDLEESINLYNDPSTRDFLGLCLNEVVNKYYNEKKDYNKSAVYLQKLVRYFPEDKVYKEMYDEVKKYVEPVKSAAATASPNTSVAPIDNSQIKKLIALMEKWASQQENQQAELLKKYEQRQKELVDRVLSSARNDQAGALKDVISTVIQRENKKTRRSSMFSAVLAGIVVAVVFVGFLVVIFIKYLKKKTAVILWHGGEGSLEALVEKARKTMAIPAQKEAPKMISDMHSLRIIEAEIVDVADADSAEEILKPFLNSADNAVKAQALKILHKYNPVKSLDGFREMISSGNEQARLKAFNQLAEICTQESVYMMLKNFKGSNYNERKIIIRAFNKIVSEKRECVPPKILETIKKTLDNLKKQGEWIIE